MSTDTIPVIPADQTDLVPVSTDPAVVPVVPPSNEFKLFYQKPKNDNVLKDLENSHMGLKNCQNYIPIYSSFFSLNDTNFNSINLNQKHSVKAIFNGDSESNNNIKSKNIANAEIFPVPKYPYCKSSGQNGNVPVFFKFSPLLDPIKYLAGNYNIENKSLFNLPSIHSKTFDYAAAVVNDVDNNDKNRDDDDSLKCHFKVMDKNNSAYVDGFFSYLSSQLLNTHGFIHGIDFYGSCLAVQNEFTVNIIDDQDYLLKTDFFKEKNGVLFKYDAPDCEDDSSDYENMNNQRHTKNKNTKLNIVVENVDIVFDNFDTSDAASNAVSDSGNNDGDGAVAPSCLNDLTELVDECIFSNNRAKNDDNDDDDDSNNSNDSSSFSCSSRSSYTTNDESSEGGSNGSKSSGSSDSGSSGSKSSGSSGSSDSGSCSGSETDTESFETIDDEILNAVIYNFPVEVIMLENCTKTLDYLMVKDSLSDEEWEAALMQIVITLATYQKIFEFTHNDLHTNNIMFVETDAEFLYYCFNKKYYKVPTYGRIFKIIDFGRSIYKFNSNLVCSDSFHKSGDAATQYNFEPYFNDKKARIEPNFSFDLCRLGCSLFDFFIEDMEDVGRECKKSQLVSLVVEWVTDDNDRNILYKKNGVDRYPDFKLYKMIARTVHNKVPSQQLKNRVFSQFEITHKSIRNVSKSEIINIDKLPVYI